MEFVTHLKIVFPAIGGAIVSADQVAGSLGEQCDMLAR
jgi:hypothetical protein